MSYQIQQYDIKLTKQTSSSIEKVELGIQIELNQSLILLFLVLYLILLNCQIFFELFSVNKVKIIWNYHVDILPSILHKLFQIEFF